MQTACDLSGNVFEAGGSMLSCLSPPISAIFLMGSHAPHHAPCAGRRCHVLRCDTVPLAGAFWARGTHQAALITLVSGFIVGAHLASHRTLHYCRACELLTVLAFGCGRVAGRDGLAVPAPARREAEERSVARVVHRAPHEARAADAIVLHQRDLPTGG